MHVGKWSYNKKSKALYPTIEMSIKLNSVRLGMKAQINYFDIGNELANNADFQELMGLNLQAVGYRALQYLIECIDREHVSANS